MGDDRERSPGLHCREPPVSTRWLPENHGSDAIAIPTNGNWVVRPHFASYLGLINGKEPSGRYAELAELNHTIGSDRIAVTGRLKRLGAQVTQDFAFASLPSDVTVYVERLTAKESFHLTSRETGIVGHEYDLGTNERVLHGRFGKQRIVGVGGEATTHEWRIDWPNVGDRVGYVVCRVEGRENLHVGEKHGPDHLCRQTFHEVRSMDGTLRSSIENQLLYGTRYSGTGCISIACCFSQAT